MPCELLLESAQDGPRRLDGELLADDLEDERPEGIERRELVEPGTRMEVWARVDQARFLAWPISAVGLPTVW